MRNMSDDIGLQIFNSFLIGMIIIAVIVFIVLFVVPAGYGQMIKQKWGSSVNNRVGWVIMEFPVVLLFFIFWIASDRRFETMAVIFFLLFNLHYIQRTFIFPALIRGNDLMPWSIIIFGMVFNTANAYMQGMWIFYYAPDYGISWLSSAQFIIGVIVFLAGFLINIHSDHIIRNLRKPGDTAFHVPMGGFFKYVTSANYFGEFTEWVGWAIMTWSLPGLIFAIWTFANLGPRANALRKWYIEKFGEEFPKDRKRMIPFIY
jgi:3-oxo-5-alpha-steroid 4-dehydrogenase 1